MTAVPGTSLDWRSRGRPRRTASKRYGRRGAEIKRRLAAAIAVLVLAAGGSTVAAEPAGGLTIVALGDSLTAGYRLDQGDAFPARLERALRDRGHEVTVVNGGVSGDTSSAVLSRLDWSVPEGADAAIVEVGANDALRGIDPDETRRALSAIVRRLQDRGIEVLIAGMRAPPNMGGDYDRRFKAVFRDVAGETGALLYPFFLDGVAADRALNLDDGMHPNARGVAVIVDRILPSVEELMSRVRENRQAGRS